MGDESQEPTPQAVAEAVASGDRRKLQQLFTAAIVTLAPTLFDYLYPPPPPLEPEGWDIPPAPEPEYEYSLTRVETGRIVPPFGENGWVRTQIALSPTGATVLWRRELQASATEQAA